VPSLTESGTAALVFNSHVLSEKWVLETMKLDVQIAEALCNHCDPCLRSKFSGGEEGNPGRSPPKASL
jgi:hypothetical protein